MRQQYYLNRTLRDVPADAEAASHRWMLRAGLIRQLSSGIYSYLPLGLKALQRIQNIVRDALDSAGAQELLLPTLHPSELWKQSGRWDVYGPELMRLEDRHGRSFALGATHEEVITSLVKDEIHSYKKLPVTLYQIQTKFRDERRPRFGLLRGREFVMKDAYSFDHYKEGLNRSYQAMYDAYSSIFARCGLKFRAVEADSGAMGGSDTHEFMALADIGEDTIAHCEACGYAANVEKAVCAIDEGREIPLSEVMEPVRIHTPGIKTIADLSPFMHIQPFQIIKTVAYNADGKPLVVLIRGDYEVSETKLMQALRLQILERLTEDQIHTLLQSVAGFMGPIGLANDVQLIADFSVRGMHNAVAGANIEHYHLKHVTPVHHCAGLTYSDLRTVTTGDLCRSCHVPLSFAEGIEVGQVFKLGTKYSEALGATYIDDIGKERPMVMGCYGIGISRTLAAIIEQHHDEAGIVWPVSVAPFTVHLITISMKDELQADLSLRLYSELKTSGLEVLWDDRDERPGVKFNDSDIIGLPIRVTIGKKAAENIVECKIRQTGAISEISIEHLIPWIHQFLKEATKNERSKT